MGRLLARLFEAATPGAPQVGQPAPPLRLPTLEGGGLDLDALRGTPVLVSFLRHAG